MILQSVHATFEAGVFKPTEPVTLPDHCEVEFEPHIVAGSLTMRPMDEIYSILTERYAGDERDIAARHYERRP